MCTKSIQNAEFLFRVPSSVSNPDLINNNNKPSKTTTKNKNCHFVAESKNNTKLSTDMASGSTKWRTGFITDPKMEAHYNMWDIHHIEIPDRLIRPLNKLKQMKVYDRLQQLTPRTADVDNEIMRIHDKIYIDAVKATRDMNDTELEKTSSSYEDVYFNGATYELALLSAGCAIEAVKAVLENKVRNAFALIRPPGHHAMRDRPCGFCFFNNVALCAKIAVDDYQMDRVLIIDWDVHAANGTQDLIKDDPRILLVSMHRFDNGAFWPNLHDTNWDYSGNTLNIPLNELGVGDSAYLFLFHHFLIPLVIEWDPQLVLISAGYDAALGDPQGLMRMTPAGYAHLTHYLLPMANGKVCALYEGGYFLDSVELDVLWTIKTLLGDCPPMLRVAKEPPRELVKVLLQLCAKHQHKFECFRQLLKTIEVVGFMKNKPLFTPYPIAPFSGVREMVVPHPLKNLYPPRPVHIVQELKTQLQQFVSTYEFRSHTARIVVNTEVALWGDAKHILLENDLTISDAIRSVMNDGARAVIMRTEHGFRFSDFEDEIPYWKKRLLLFSIGDRAAADVEFCKDSFAIGMCTGTKCAFENEKKRFTLQLRHECTTGEVFYAFQHVIQPLMYEFAPELLIVHLGGTVAWQRYAPVMPYIINRCSALAVGRILCTINPAIDDEIVQLISKSVSHDRPLVTDFSISNVGDDLHSMIADCWLKTADKHNCFHFAERNYELLV